MNPALPAEARVLTSAAFRRARLRAASAVNSPDDLRSLLAQADAMRDQHPRLASGMTGLDLDIVCAVLDAHLETPPHAGMSWAPDGVVEPLSITGTARLRLVVAALLYLVDADDAVPDSRPDGLRDDALVLHWASRMARAELPAA